MEEKNYKISAFQFAVICAFLIDALFVGIGITNTFVTTKQDSWILVIVGTIIGLLPLMILMYIISYRPELNIFDKNKALFGNVIGNIINFIMALVVFFILTIGLLSTTYFAVTMYLIKTPNIFIALSFTVAAIYAANKGIETISRVGEILFFLAVIIVGIIVISLYSHFEFYELKPILADGIMPIVKNIPQYLTYSITPLILLMIIPKDNIVKNKRYRLFLIGGYFIGMLLMFFVFYLIPGVITPKIAALYRFPAYYVLRKVTIGGAIENVENFISIHWFFNTFLLVTMGIYFIKVYIRDTFKMNKTKHINIVGITIGLAAVGLTNYIFKNPASLPTFMREQFPLFISLPILTILIITCILIFINRRTNKKTTS